MKLLRSLCTIVLGIYCYNVHAMNTKRIKISDCGSEKKEAQEIIVNDDQRLLDNIVVHNAQDVTDLLYEVLDPMPLDLIKIIVAYDAYAFKGILSKTFQLQHKNIVAGLFPLSDNRLGIITAKGTLHIFDLEKGESSSVYFNNEIKNMGGFSRALQISENLIAVSFARAAIIRLLDIKNQQLLRGFDVTKSEGGRAITSLVLLPDGRFVAGVSGDRDHADKILIFDMPNKHVSELFDEMKMPQGNKVLTSSNNWLAAYSLARGVNVLDRSNGRSLTMSHSLLNTQFSFVPLSERLCAAGVNQNALKYWDIKTGECVLKMAHVPFVKNMQRLSDGSLVTLDNNNEMRVFNPKTGAVNCAFKAHDAAMGLEPMIVLPSGLLATAAGGEIKLWR